MRNYLKFFIDGRWVDPVAPKHLDVVNPATEATAGRISLASEADVDRAVRAARRAFADFSHTSRDERIALLTRIIAEYERRIDDLADAVTEEMGAPVPLARQAQAPAGLAHFKIAREALKTYSFEAPLGATRVFKEAIGVCGLITPWNWPLNQIACKLAPALATGCAVVLKPSEIAPFSAAILAEIIAVAGAPAGVFNLVNGDGGAGAALSAHPLVDMVSFTGSTRAGVEVAQAAAPTVKRVAQELGGKCPDILLEDGTSKALSAGRAGRHAQFRPILQCADAPARPGAPVEEAIRLARAAGEALIPGDRAGGAEIGPVVSENSGAGSKV